MLITGAELAPAFQQYDLVPWTLVVAPTTELGVQGGSHQDAAQLGRAVSRIPKLVPQVFFDAPITVFMDWKLVLRQHPLRLIQATLGGRSDQGVRHLLRARGQGIAGFVAFRHPCTTTYTTVKMCQKYKGAWLHSEAAEILR